MYYKEMLVARRAVAIYCALVALTMIVVFLAGASAAHRTITLHTYTAGLMAWLTCILAIVLGASLANERRLHVLLFPKPRVVYALTVIAVDAAALVVAYLLSSACIAIFLLDGKTTIVGTPSLFADFFVPIAGILAFYGVSCVVTLIFRLSAAASLILIPIAGVLWAGATTRWAAEPTFVVLNAVNP